MAYEVSNQYFEASSQPRFNLGYITYDNNLGVKLKYVQFTTGALYINGDVVTITSNFVASLNQTTKIDGIVLYDVDALDGAKYGWVIISTDNPVWVNYNASGYTGAGSGKPSAGADLTNSQLQGSVSGATRAPAGKVVFNTTAFTNITSTALPASADTAFVAEVTSAINNVAGVVNSLRKPLLWGEGVLSAFTSTANTQSAKMNDLPDDVYLTFTATGDTAIYISGLTGAATLPVSAVLREGSVVVYNGSVARVVEAVDNSSGGITAALSSALSSAELGYSATAALAASDSDKFKIGALKVLCNFTK
jgi:hypothetical protein